MAQSAPTPPDPNPRVTRRHITSAAELRALAHPLRIDLLDLLATHGPLSATEAAEVLGQTPANVSWHLRKLGEHGYVQQDRSGPGRRRPWRTVSRAHSWGEDGEDREAAAALRDLVVRREVDVMWDALDRHEQESQVWREATMFHQYRAWLTPEEAKQVSEQMFTAMAGYLERLDDAATRPAGARLMALMGWVVPFEPAPANGSTA